MHALLLALGGGIRSARSLPCSKVHLASSNSKGGPLCRMPADKELEMSQMVQSELNLLKRVVSELRTAFEVDGLGDTMIQRTLNLLAEINSFKPYRADQYPGLVSTESFESSLGQAPASLAEAFIWKQGDWLKYQSFVSYYALDSQEPTSGHVHYAFAKHLRDPKRIPIFDQNSLRAVWAICPLLTASELRSIESYLVVSSGKNKGAWKSNAGGGGALASMKAFFRVMQVLVSKPGSTNIDSIDKLLMPLGSLLKGLKSCSGDTKVAAFKRLRAVR